MSYQVFARKYRPKTFSDVLGQDHVVQTLRNAIDQDRLAHAYLFVGPRGTGKTSTARIFAKALNCPDGPKLDFDPDDELCVEIAEGRSLDVLEIDGASNNGVEQVRALRENVQFAPARARYKIYYIDEVHMLSNQAFNALLKTLEEPPEHVKFIFATTEPHKILPTIISRCQRFDLRPIPTETIASHLQHIAQQEGITLDDAAAWAVAKGADGGMRDAQSMFDQLVAFCGDTIVEQNVLDIFGFTSRETVSSLTSALLRHDSSSALTTIKQQAESGKDLTQLLGELIACVRALLVSKVDPNAGSEGFPDSLWLPLLDLTAPLPTDKLLSLVDVFAEADGRMKWASNKRLHFELAVIKAIQTLGEVRLSDVIATLGKADIPDHPSAAAPIATPAAATAPPVVDTPAPATTPEPAPPTQAVAEPAPQPSVPDTPPEPESKPEPEPVAPPAETPAAPVVAEPEPTVADTLIPESTPSTPPKERAPDAFARFGALLDAAPDEPDPAQVAENQAAQAKKKDSSAAEPEAKIDEESATAKQADREEKFYNDPLIQEALRVFEGKIETS